MFKGWDKKYLAIHCQEEDLPDKEINYTLLYSLGGGLIVGAVAKKVGAPIAYALGGAYGFFQLLKHYGYLKVDLSEIQSRLVGELSENYIFQMGLREYEIRKKRIKKSATKMASFVLGAFLSLLQKSFQRDKEVY